MAAADGEGSGEPRFEVNMKKRLTDKQILEIIMLSVKNIAIEHKMAGIREIVEKS